MVIDGWVDGWHFEMNRNQNRSSSSVYDYLMAVPLELGVDVGHGHGFPLHVGDGVFERFGAAYRDYNLLLTKIYGHVIGRFSDLQD